MKQVTRAQGQVTFNLPDSAAEPKDLAPPSRPGATRRGGARATPSAEPDDAEFAAIIDALVNPDSQIRPDSTPDSGARRGGARTGTPRNAPPSPGITVLDSFAIEVEQVPPPARTRGTRGAGAVGPIEIDVTLEAGEGAVVLLEQDGTYEWRFPQASAPAQRASGNSRRGGTPSPADTQRHLRFAIDVREDAPPAPATRGAGATRGRMTSFIKGKIKGFILKFVVRKVVGAITQRLERGVLEGPVVIGSADVQNDWLLKDSFVGIPLPTDRPARILLFVHGTFSSTVGSFAALSRHPDGQAFLQTAFAQYDAVLGYDHYTLSETPDQNAEAINGALRELLADTPSLSIDAVAFSRGGLVLRYLTEQVAPLDDQGVQFKRLVFVGCTNAGTELANDENWNDLVDFYTNMVAGATRLLGFAPGAALPTRILRGAVQSIGSMVTYIAEDAVANKSVPGVAAMEPAGEFVKAINSPPVSRSISPARELYALGSSFEPDRDTANGALGKRLIAKAADGLVDRLMGKDNDLVVNTDSMFVVDPAPGARLTEKRVFDDNGLIYHTVYFTQPTVAKALSSWLIDKATGTRGTRAMANRMGATTAPRDWWTSAVDTDVVTLPVTITGKQTVRRLKQLDSENVALQRVHDGEVLSYGIRRQELLDRINQHHDTTQSLVDILYLHEYQSRGIDESAAIATGDARALRHLAEQHANHDYLAVITDGRDALGVVPRATLSPPDTVIAMASATHEPATRASVTRGAATRGSARGTRGAGTAASPPTLPVPAAHIDEVLCHVHASMADKAVLEQPTTVEVLLSRKEIEEAIGVAGSVTVKTDRPLIVEVLARKHCKVGNESRADVPVPSADQIEPTRLYFDVIPKAAGIGEVDVLVRQGNYAMVNLRLKPEFVKSLKGGGVDRTVAQAAMQPDDGRKQAVNVLQIFETEIGNKPMLQFWLTLGSLGKRVTDHSEPFKNATAKDKYINDLYLRLEEFNAISDNDYDAFISRLRACGLTLFDELVPQKIQALLWKHRDDIDHIQVLSSEALIPWELVALKQPGKKAKLDAPFLAEMGLVRWLDHTAENRLPARQLRLREGRFGHVTPKYPSASGYALPGAQSEAKLLVEKFGAVACPSSSIKLQEQLLNPGKYDVLHFACHGVADTGAIWNSGLMMKGAMDNGRYRPDHLLWDQVKNYADLREEGKPGPVVFVNACQTGRSGDTITSTGGFAQAFLNSGADMFIAAQWAVGDYAATTFSTTLYDQLLNRKKTVVQAVAAARKAARNKKELTWLSYVVYADPYAKVVSE